MAELVNSTSPNHPRFADINTFFAAAVNISVTVYTFDGGGDGAPIVNSQHSTPTFTLD